MPSAAVTRKRSRPRLVEQGQADDQNELSINSKDTPLSTAKKRKLNADGTPPANKTKYGSLEKVGAAIGGLIRWQDKKGKENAEDDDTESDILDPNRLDFDGNLPGNVHQSMQDFRGTRSTSTPKSKEKSQWKHGAMSKAQSSATNEEEKDIWEVPGSESEGTDTRRAMRKKLGNTEPSKPAPKSMLDTQVTSHEPKRRGRPRKSDILKKATALSHKAIRDRMMAASEGRGDEGDEDEGEEEAATRTHLQRTPRGEQVSLNTQGPTNRIPSPRKRGRPRKNPDDSVKSTQILPKGILTPSKKDRTLKSRKSVAFQERDDLDLGFKDLPEISSTRRQQDKKQSDQLSEQIIASKAFTSDVDEEITSDEEEACAVCSGLKSRKGNEIILCDGCDFAVHLKCYRLSSVPEGEWHCRNCLPEKEDEKSGTVDEIACAVCSGLQSKRGNQIILCDTCDFAVHLQCYQLDSMPKGNWFCRVCQPESEEIALTQLVDTSSDPNPSALLPDIPHFELHLRAMQRVLLDKLTGQKQIQLCGHDDEMQKVQQVVEQTVLAGEGNSMLIIGARGSGKTTLVETVLFEISVEHRQSFHVVRLNGFIHTDDKLALKEIWRQLGREMEVDEEENGRSNYADTLASLLALLSHPSEMSESEPDQIAKSVVFILDEFDLFTTHPRQTLLYNLFDIAQAKKAPIVVLGLTTRVDVVESLEKRVKSRFSHRYVHLSLPRNVPAFWEICKRGLIVDNEEISSDRSDLVIEGQYKFLSFWRSMIEELYSKDTLFKRHIQSQFYRTKSVPVFFSTCILPIANLTMKDFALTGQKFVSDTLSLSAPDSKLQILRGLSELELALLIAAARLDIILDTDTCNFAMAYDEYSSLTSRHKIQTSSTGVNALGSSAKVWGRDAALGSWERLAEYDLLVPAAIGGGGGRDIGAGGRMWKVDVGLEEVTGSVEGLNAVMTKWCREI